MANACQGTLSQAALGLKSEMHGEKITKGFRSGFLNSSRKSANGKLRTRKNVSVRNVASEPKSVPSVVNSRPLDVPSVASSVKYHADFDSGFSKEATLEKKAYYATSLSLRDNLLQRWTETFEHFRKEDAKQIYYISMEFLQGRSLTNALGNLELTDVYSEALKQIGVKLEDLVDEEPNAALGNGGLGRLASCFLDSIATLNYPGWGYGLRYQYGLFKQAITNEGQAEMAENWLETGYPWEVPRFDINYPIKFFGQVVEGPDGKKQWVGGEDIKAVAYDVPIPGYKTKNTISLRLWNAEVLASDFDLAAFNSGDHEKAVRAQANAKTLCAVLYPGDETKEGKILRLKQQYMLCSASIQDMLAEFEKRAGPSGPNWANLSNKIAIQMNDTHPTLSAPELMRILMDVKGLSWDEAWKITQGVVAYTNHTVLPEALEKWSQDYVKSLLPRHFEIIEKIDEQFIHELISAEAGTEKKALIEKIESMRILLGSDLPKSVLPLLETEASDSSSSSSSDSDKDKKKEVKKESVPKVVRMANLCVIAGHTVNGVAAIHSDIVKDEVFNDFYKLWPHKFQNKTNGVTPRRWIKFCNPSQSKVISKWLGHDEWVLDADRLSELKQFVDNKEFQSEWSAAKRENKVKLAAYIREKTGYAISPDVMFDIQVKRIHEYKRQLLNILGVVYKYKKMKEMSADERSAKFEPRAVIFGGKAFATYVQAKRIVRFICDVAKVVNNDPEIGDLLKVVFVPDYNVSVAEILIPASDLSQHISTAGMEASGTSNMKFSMNGCVLIGTLDGANVEIREEVGEENFFLFGARAEEIAGLREDRRLGKYVPDPRFEEVKAHVRSGVFGNYYDDMIGSLEGNEGFGRADYFLVGYDFPAYIECQEKVDQAYRNREGWVKSSIMNCANSGKFSSDRTIHQYAKEIWGIEQTPVP